MRSNISTILATARSSLWAITPAKLDAVMAFLEARSLGADYTDEQLAARGIPSAASRPVGRSTGDVAVLPLFGVIGQHAGMEMMISGGTSTESFGRAFDAALANSAVGTILIDAHSPGGTVQGVPETANKIVKARGQKQIIAVANSEMCSAAYWLCAAADQVIASPSADVGSIGVFMQHTDISGAEAKAGVVRTVIAAGKYKREAAGVPLTEEALEALQARVDECYGMFAGDVARFMGVSVASVKNGFGEGRSVSAKAALAAGMIHDIATIEDVLADLTGRASAKASRRAAYSRHLELAAIAGGSTLDAAATIARLSDAQLSRVLAAIHSDDVSDPEKEPDVPESVPAPDEGPEARGGRVMAPNDPATNRQAPKAGGSTMSDQDTAALKAAIEKDVRTAETTRVSEIFALTAEHKIDATQRDQWVASGASVDAVSRQILAIGRDRAAAAPVISNGSNLVSVGADRATQRPWETFGHFAAAVMEANTPGSRSQDVRLSAAQGVNQSIPSEGGFLVPPTFSTKIWDEMAMDNDDLLGMTDNYPIDGESLTMNANAETSRANGSRFGGVRGYWINEAAQITKSQPKWRAMRLEPQELGVFIYATDKSIRNSPVALGSYLDRAAKEEIKFMTGAAIFAGTGAGQPQGLMGSGSLITVAKETSQPAATIQQENVSKMWARLHPRARANAVWLLNVDCEPQLDFLNTVVKNVAGTENVGGYANKVYDAEKRTLKGRPIITTEYNETLGTLGDIVLVNLGWYATGTRSTGVRADTSIHLRFDYNETAFRFMYEVDGQPWLASALTPYKGAATLSWAVALATRA